MAVPTTALFMALSVCAGAGVAPPICEAANWRQSLSSKRNWAKLLVQPGSTITLGPDGGGVAQPASNAIPAGGIGAEFVFGGGGPGGRGLPPPGPTLTGGACPGK